VALAALLCVGITAIFTLPILPIDETRSLSVAWEMWTRKSFLLPLLNGQPYAHKPPLLFWLIHLTWFIFGVNEVTPRLIPMFFAMANIFLVYRVSLQLWPGDKKTAKYATLLLSVTLVYLVWSFLILYEMLLTFWVLVAVHGILSASKAGGKRPWLQITLGIGGGILTKGPVVLVHVVPLLVLAPWWNRMPKDRLPGWYGRAFGSCLLGLLLAGLWVAPAVIQGGEAYRHALLWRQTAARVVASFAHRRPLWWYIPVLPLLFLPWIFFLGIWKGIFTKEIRDTGWRACVTWFVSTLIILSFVSGKQAYYPIPATPAVILLFARNLRLREDMAPVPWRTRGMGIVLTILGGIFLLSSWASVSMNTGRLSLGEVAPIACVLLGFGIFFLVHTFFSPGAVLKTTAICVTVVFSLFLATTGKIFLKKYDLKPLALLINAKMEKRDCVAFVGTYHGEFQFLGRLHRPLISLKGESYKKFLAAHPDCLVIDTLKAGKAQGLKKEDFCYIQPFREQRVIFMTRGEIYLDIFGR